jgi:hypothetical protein
MSTNSEMTGLLAFVCGKPGSGKSAFTKFLIRNIITKAEEKGQPIEGLMVFCGDPQQWKGLIPDEMIITPTVYEQFEAKRKDWWKEFYDKQQEFMSKNGRYSEWIIIIDDALLFSSMIRAGGNNMTNFEKVLSMYRALRLRLIVTTQRTKGFTVALRQFCSMFVFFPAAGELEIRDIYSQFGSGIWTDKKACMQAFERLAAEKPHSFMMVNKRKQESDGSYAVKTEHLGETIIANNERMQITVEDPQGLMPVPFSSTLEECEED